jgi:hypothetical protein
MQADSNTVHQEMQHSHVVQNTTDTSMPPVQVMDWFPNRATPRSLLMALNINWSFQVFARREGGHLYYSLSKET